MRNVLIVFSGKAQSGKSTSAKVLQDVLGTNKVEIYSFATALKKIAQEYFNWDGIDKGIYMHDVKVPDQRGHRIVSQPIPDKGRQLLINIGQYMRKIRSTIWIDYVVNQIKKEISIGSDRIFVIDDLRFRNELELVKVIQPCISIRLTRNSQLDLNDISETDLDNSEFDYYIDNNGTIEDLKKELSKVYEDILFKVKNDN